jgi:hypothetical protein
MLDHVRRSPAPRIVNWAVRFDRPIPLPGRASLFSLRDAAAYISTLPKSERDASRWRLAAEALLCAGEHGGDPAAARLHLMRALHRREVDSAFTRQRRQGRRAVARPIPVP